VGLEGGLSEAKGTTNQRNANHEHSKGGTCHYRVASDKRGLAHQVGIPELDTRSGLDGGCHVDCRLLPTFHHLTKTRHTALPRYTSVSISLGPSLWTPKPS
jgi:hypothetical protein